MMFVRTTGLFRIVLLGESVTRISCEKAIVAMSLPLATLLSYDCAMHRLLVQPTSVKRGSCIPFEPKQYAM